MEKMTFKEKMLELQKRVQPVKKDTPNPFFKSKYASLDDILAEVKPIMSELRLLLRQPTLDGMVRTYVEDVDSESYFYGEMELPKDLEPQKMGSAISYYKRYTLQALLALETEDDDGEATRTAHSAPGRVAAPDVMNSTPEQLTGYAAKLANNTPYEGCNLCGSEKMLNPKTGKVFCKAKCFIPENSHLQTEYLQTKHMEKVEDQSMKYGEPKEAFPF